nr:HD domain-containing protein [Geomonas sp. Red32]
MPNGHLGIIFDILCLLDADGLESSVRSRYRAIGQYGLQGQVTLLEHSINVATICRVLAAGRVIEVLAVIAGLGHDCGKLPSLHPGPYVAAMHAHWSAEHIRYVIEGRLPEVQAEAVVEAIRRHHLAGGGALHRVLREADGRARSEEIQTIINRSVGGRQYGL